MSRSTFFKANEQSANSTPSSVTSTTNSRRFHHNFVSTNRSTDTKPVVVIESTSNQSIVRLNPKKKRNLRDKRRATGIRPDEVSLASSPTDASTDEDEKDKTKDSNDSSTTPMFTVSRVPPPLEKLSLGRSDLYGTSSSSSSSKTHSNPTTKNIFLPEEFRIRRQQQTDEEPTVKIRQLEERLRTVESLVYDKDTIIHDLQRKLDKANRDLAEAEQQIYSLQKEKLTLIKAFASLQDNKSSSTGFITRT